MFAKINYFFYQKYENSDFIIQQRVKILLSICVTMIFVILALTVSYIIKGEKDLGVLLPTAICGLILIVGLVMIKYGTSVNPLHRNSSPICCGSMFLLQRNEYEQHGQYLCGFSVFDF